MKKGIIILFSLAIVLTTFGQKSTAAFYQFHCKNITGEDISMNSYKGKVVLIVNTASKCGFTPQYEGLEALYKKYKNKGLVILGFPCNQFAGQEPGSSEEIAKFCTLKYGVSFPMFQKIEVNGEKADTLYKYLKNILPGTMGNDVKWNFTKFLLDKKGQPFKRYAPSTKPEDITADIEKLLL
ncbi:MAG: glutathione peroxidase [Paludibacter sp.]|nr:glutathione peroxidase [Paludibacter sp.]